MKHVRLFEEFVTSQKNVDTIIESAFNETEIQLDELTYSVNEGLVKQALGWIFFPGFSLLNVAYQFFRRRSKIKKMMAAEQDPAKRDKLRQELETLKYEEVKAKEKVKAKEEELKDKAAQARRKMTPEEREEFDKEMAKKRKELEKAKEKFNKEKQEFQGLV